MSTLPNLSVERSQQIKAQLEGLASRDLQLWSIGFLVMVVLAVAALSAAAPALLARSVSLQLRYIPQLALGLIALVLLLNFYLVEQRRSLTRTRLELIRELTLNETLDRFSYVDPATELFTRNYLTHLLGTEAKRSNREGRAFTLVAIDAVQTNASADGDVQLPTELARLLRRTFRGSDTIVKLGEHRYLVVMPATPAKEARKALNRLNANIDEWNLNTPGVEVLLNCAVRPCLPGEDPWRVLRDTEQQLQEIGPGARQPADEAVLNAAVAG